MYLKHFGLSEFPFGLTPDTQFYFDLPSHREALNVLLIALQNGEGFIKITGNVGVGKTMLCRKLLNELQPPFVTAYIPNPHISATALHLSIASELGISFSRETGKTRLLQLLNKHLLDNAEKLQKTVLIIDEAQAMPLETLEALRLLTNLETEKQKLLQIVLFGQPELNTLLQKKSIRQLRQRISFSYALKELSPIDVEAYIKHRLTIANSASPTIFTNGAINALHFYSMGIPRLINILSHKALLSAYGSGLLKIGVKQIRLAAADTEDTCKLKQPFECRKQIVIALFATLCLLAFNHFNLA